MAWHIVRHYIRSRSYVAMKQVIQLCPYVPNAFNEHMPLAAIA
jgi:hypothetical protein